MVSRPDARLDLARLLAHVPDLEPEVREEGLLEPSEEALREDGLRLRGPLAWSVTVRRTGGEEDFIAEGEVEGTALMECRRCLTEVEAPVHTSFLYPMEYVPSQEANLRLVESEDGVEDHLTFSEPEVDFAYLLRQLFAIDLPLAPLCREGCRGLAIDGVNLNEHPDHVPEGVRAEDTSPFAALKDLDLDPDSRE